MCSGYKYKHPNLKKNIKFSKLQMIKKNYLTKLIS